MTRPSAGKLICVVIVASIVCSGIYRVLSIRSRVQNALAAEKLLLKDRDKVRFELTRFLPHDQDTVTVVQNTNAVRDLARFNGELYAATDGGLIRIGENGEILRHYTVLDGLPESDLLCLSAFNGKLYIGTRTSGLVVFDGEEFAGYKFPDHKTEAITAFAEGDGALLIGTFAGGLLRFDGTGFTEIKAGSDPIAAVNCIRTDGPKLYVGTFNTGLFIHENDMWSHFSTTEGLPSNRIVSIASIDENLYVATDFGLAVLDGDTFRNLITLPALSGAAVFDSRLFLVKDDGQIFIFDRSLKDLFPASSTANSRLNSLDEKLWLLSGNGISRFEDGRIKPFTKISGPLTDNFVSALAAASNGSLWVGSFHRGIDILAANGENLKHIENENVREINYLEPIADSVSASTSAGLIRFPDVAPGKSLTAKEGLPSNSVTQTSGDVIATAKGLAFNTDGRVRLLTTVQGLPNNSVYTTIKVGDKLYAGTLGGIAEIVDGRVVKTFKDSNSNLTTNWVTAFCRAGDRFFIGTYGGGIFELTASGDISSFEHETGKFTVNNNAMYSDGERLYAGTLTSVKVLDLNTLEWKTYKNILPSQTVMSITGDDAAVYFGTASGIARVKRTLFTREEEK